VWTLGINWKWHDSSAALVDEDGKVRAFAEEERFTRVKHAWETFPTNAARYCLATAGITWRDLDAVAVGWAFEHLRGDEDEMLVALFGEEASGRHRPKVEFVPHHLAHALSAFHSSGYDRAGVLVIDGSGETDSATIYRADRENGLTALRSWDRRYSLGSLYMAATQWLGFGRLDAGKTMGLAPYGVHEATSVLPVGDFIAGTPHPLSPAGALSPDRFFEDFTAAWSSYFAERFGPVTAPSAELHRDPVARSLAATAQRTVEHVFRALHAETVALSGSENVCLAGGVALNCVANGQLPEPLYVPPFPHDAGVAVGAAWFVSPPRRTEAPVSPYLGAEPRRGAEVDDLRAAGCAVSDFSVDAVIEALVAGRVGAIAEGRAEVGPRALGHRSIIALPRPSDVQDRINGLKNRERWRPFAPVTLASYAPRLWPRQGARELYMIGTTVVSSHGRELLPAATHVDGTTRSQVVESDQPQSLAAVLRGLEASGVPPVLVNTSFNDRGEPIVNSAADAARAFLALGLDFLVLDGLLVERPRTP
jgi:carbamoyltransferase